MKYAVVSFGGTQLKIEEGGVFELERQQPPYSVDVLLYRDGKTLKIGQPVVKDVSVSLDLLEEKRAKKVRVARFKSKSRYRKVKGHRQPMSVFKVKKISVKANKSKKSEEKEKE